MLNAKSAKRNLRFWERNLLGVPKFEKSMQNLEVNLKILILCDFHLRNPDFERMGRRGEERVSEVERAEKYSPLIKSGLIFHSVYAAGKLAN